MKKALVHNLLPDFLFQSITDIPVDFFRTFTLVVLDVDNTLFFPETTKINEEVIKKVFLISNTCRCVCLSNSRTIMQRKNTIESMLGCEVFISRRKKPSSKLFEEMNNYYHVSPKEVVVVGDRIFTDILFANLSGATSILVDPLTKKENILIYITRYIEKFLLFLLGGVHYNKNKHHV